MNIFNSVFAARLIFILGIINLLTGFLVLLTCRCLPTSRIGSKLMQYTAYNRFYRYHCYIWWIFWTSVIIHAAFAIGLLGIPF